MADKAEKGQILFVAGEDEHGYAARKGGPKMKRTALTMTCMATVMLSAAAEAGPFSDDLGRCTVTATTTADRDLLLRWIFVTAAANPALSDLTAATPAIRTRVIRAAAGVFSRVLLVDCRAQAIAALRNEGPGAMSAGFELMGRAASRQMLSAPGGAASLDQLVDEMDMDGLIALGREAGVQMGPPPR